MSQEVRQFLAGFLRQHRAEIVDLATDWVIAQAKDLKGQRPRAETHRLVDGVVTWNEALILAHDDGPLGQFVSFVTTYRASSEFHISTLLRGFASFRAAMANLLEKVEPGLAFACLRIVDDAYLTAIFHMGDKYVAKLNHTLIERRQQLEQEIERLAEQRRREFQEAVGVINGQRELLLKVSLPIISVFQHVLVVPLIGELSAERASELTMRLLEAIVAHRAKLAILDITGLPALDQTSATMLFKLGRAVELLGAVAMLVGISPSAAAEMVRLGQEPLAIKTFSSLADGLIEALRLQGYQLQRAPGRVR